MRGSLILVPAIGNSIDLGTTFAKWRNLFLGSTLEVDGNTVLGTSGINTVTFNARVASSLLPAFDNTYTLGTSQLSWNTVWTHGLHVGTALTDSAVINSGISSNLTPFSNNTYDLGTVANEWRNLYLSNTLNVAGNSVLGNSILSDVITLNSTNASAGGFVPSVDSLYNMVRPV